MTPPDAIRRSPDLDAVTGALFPMLPRFTLDEQRIALALYQQLARGEPVRPERLASATGRTAPDVERLLEGEALKCVLYRDDARRVIGFGGMAVGRMHHRLLVGDRTLYAWCAWDTLFLPEMLGRDCIIESPCRETGELIRLTVGPAEITRRSHAEPVMSFLLPGAPLVASDTLSTITTFCHFVFFFASRDAGQQWLERHPDCFLLSLEDAFELARRKNALQFADAWAERTGG